MTDICVNIEKYLLVAGTSGRDWKWLQEQMQLTPESMASWRNGHKQISIDNINPIALLLKSNGVNIWTPKQLIPEGYEFTLQKQISARHNINYLLNRHRIGAPEIYNNKSFGLPKASVLNVTGKDMPMNYQNLEKWFKVFKLKKVHILTPLDLIYFPLWGEKEDSFIELRNKIKVI